MTRTTITLPGDLIDELMAEMKAKNKTQAVTRAIKDEIRARKKEKIKAMAGNMKFNSSAYELRHNDKRIG